MEDKDINKKRRQIKDEIRRAFGLNNDVSVVCYNDVNNLIIGNRNKSTIIKMGKMSYRIFQKYDIKFINCEFDCDIVIANLPHKLYFEKCTFKGIITTYENNKQILGDNRLITKDNIVLLNCIFEKNIDLNKIEFEGVVYISHNIRTDKSNVFKSSIKLYKVNFKNEVKILYSTFKNKIDLLDATFHNLLYCNNVELDYINGGIYKGALAYTDCIFNNGINIQGGIQDCNVDMTNICFGSNSKDINFQSCNFKEAKFNKCKFNSKVNFANSTFNNNADFIGADFRKETDFRNCKFKSIASFANSTFSDNADFLDCDFDRAIFKTCHFKSNINFANSTFNNNADFSETNFNKETYFIDCDFNKSINLNKAKFNEVPYFSRAVIGGSIHIKHAILNFVFDEIEQQIHNKIKAQNTTNKQQKKHDIKENNITDKRIIDIEYIASDMRDTFRLFKHTFNKNGNIIDALQYHKYELYCREIELKQSIDKRGVKAKSHIDEQKNLFRVRDFIEYILLTFYRMLCDHHTDTLRVINNIIILIALYIGFICLLFYDNIIKIINLNDKNSEYFINIINKFAILGDCCFIYIIASLCCCSIFICCIYYLYKIYKQHTKQPKQFRICLKIERYNLLKDTRIAIYAIGLIAILLILIFFITPLIMPFLPLSNLDISSIFITNLVCFGFVAIYICIVYIRAMSLRLLCCIFAYSVLVMAIGSSITFIYPLLGKLVTDVFSDLSDNHLFVSLSTIYTLLMFIMIWSLAKTARKNSVIPS